jgi:hypothetical protein
MKVDLSALLRRGRGDAIVVAGVRVGDAAASIERDALTGAEDDGHNERRTYASGTVYRSGPDGTRVEIPLAERVDGVLQRGGWLRCGEIALRVIKGRVERIFVRGLSLASLEIIGEDDIARRIGPARGHERNVGWRLHHYPDRKLVVAWDSRGDRLEHVALGPDPWQEQRLGARELLFEMLGAFHRSSPLWSEPPDGSARVRYRRIVALARALDLGTVPELAAGKFLDATLSKERHDVIAEIAARGPRPEVSGSPRASWLFSMLLQYRADVDRVVHATSGWLECSDPALLGMIATQNQLGAQIADLMIDINRWLCLLMDPAQRTFELKELIASHGWPDVNLHSIEMDEL